MKTFRVLFSALALFLAAGLTFAGQFTSASANIAYEYIPAMPGQPAQCEQIDTECVPSGTVVCTSLDGNKIGRNQLQTACGPQLFEP